MKETLKNCHQTEKRLSECRTLGFCSGLLPNYRNNNQVEVGYLHFFIHFSHREEEDEEEQEEFGDFRLVTDDNAFDSDEV